MTSRRGSSPSAEAAPHSLTARQGSDMGIVGKVSWKVNREAKANAAYLKTNPAAKKDGIVVCDSGATDDAVHRDTNTGFFRGGANGMWSCRCNHLQFCHDLPEEADHMLLFVSCHAQMEGPTMFLLPDPHSKCQECNGAKTAIDEIISILKQKKAKITVCFLACRDSPENAIPACDPPKMSDENVSIVFFCRPGEKFYAIIPSDPSRHFVLDAFYQARTVVEALKQIDGKQPNI